MISEPITSITYLILSVASIAFFGTVLVRSAEELERCTNVGQFAVGFLLLSVVTSLPEFTVAVFATAQDVVGITIGDILGSNVVNIAFVGAMVLVLARTIEVRTMLLDELAGVLYFSSLIPLILSIFAAVSRGFGVVLLSFFVVYSYFAMKRGRSIMEEDRGPSMPRRVKARILLMIVIGALGVIVSASFLVGSASTVAELFGLSKLVIGAKVVSIATSVPELVVTIVAVRRGLHDMALGNAIGSNLTNVSLILGLVLVLSPLGVSLQAYSIATAFLLIVTSSFWYFLSRGKLSRMAGLTLLMLYVAFLVVLN